LLWHSVNSFTVSLPPRIRASNVAHFGKLRHGRMPIRTPRAARGSALYNAAEEYMFLLSK
jgi:hypothetical protein